LVCDACLTTMSPTAQNPKLNMDSVRIAKLPGGSIPQSSVVKGNIRDFNNSTLAAHNCTEWMIKTFLDRITSTMQFTKGSN
jgi:hypothetical protein